MVTDWRNFLHALVRFGRVVPSLLADESWPSQRKMQQTWQASVAFSSQFHWKRHWKGLGKETWTRTRKRVWGASCRKHLQTQICTCLCRKCSSICIQDLGWSDNVNSTLASRQQRITPCALGKLLCFTIKNGGVIKRPLLRIQSYWCRGTMHYSTMVNTKTTC